MQIEDILIVINSSNRGDKLKTHLKFPDGIIQWVVAIPQDQEEQYSHIKDNLVLIPDNVPQYLSSQRQWVMETFSDQSKFKYVWLMDDDLTFFRRDADMKLKKCKTKHMKQLFIEMRKQLSIVPMVGVSTRLGNNRVTADYDEINRVTRCYAMSTKVFKQVGATFAPFEPFLAQDFHINLCWLNKGHANRIIHIYAQEDSGSNADGGCSKYRNPEIQKKVSFWMSDNHPEVKIRCKSSGNWKGYEGSRVDMVVSWKKAYKPIKKVAKGGLNAILGK